MGIDLRTVRVFCGLCSPAKADLEDIFVVTKYVGDVPCEWHLVCEDNVHGYVVASLYLFGCEL